MESFYFLIPIALVFVAIALRLLFWALHSGQYDNLNTEAHRILFDEDDSKKPGMLSTETAAKEAPATKTASSTATSPPPPPESAHD